MRNDGRGQDRQERSQEQPGIPGDTVPVQMHGDSRQEGRHNQPMAVVRRRKPGLQAQDRGERNDQEDRPAAIDAGHGQSDQRQIAAQLVRDRPELDVDERIGVGAEHAREQVVGVAQHVQEVGVKARGREIGGRRHGCQKQAENHR